MRKARNVKHKPLDGRKHSSYQQRIQDLTEKPQKGFGWKKKQMKIVRIGLTRNKNMKNRGGSDSWWQEINEAELSGYTRRMFQTLRKVGTKNMQTIPELFTA